MDAKVADHCCCGRTILYDPVPDSSLGTSIIESTGLDNYPMSAVGVAGIVLP